MEDGKRDVNSDYLIIKNILLYTVYMLAPTGGTDKSEPATFIGSRFPALLKGRSQRGKA